MDFKQIEAFVSEHMQGDCFTVNEDTVNTNEDFEKLVLAYDHSIRRDSFYEAEIDESVVIDNGNFRYPGMSFRRKPGKSPNV